jgi:hypothetical protein
MSWEIGFRVREDREDWGMVVGNHRHGGRGGFFHLHNNPPQITNHFSFSAKPSACSASRRFDLEKKKTEETEEVSSGQCSVGREEKETALRSRFALPGIEEVGRMPTLLEEAVFSSSFPITHHK